METGNGFILLLRRIIGTPWLDASANRMEEAAEEFRQSMHVNGNGKHEKNEGSMNGRADSQKHNTPH